MSRSRLRRPERLHLRPPWAYVDLAPTGGAVPTYLAFDWGTPTGTDLNDATAYTLGVKFGVSEATSCVGVEWYTPGTAPSSACTFSLWNFDTQERLATKNATVTATGVELQTLFDSAVDLSTGVNYMASVFTPNRYVGTANYTWPQTDGILVADLLNGFFTANATEAIPASESGNDSNYHVSPLVTG